MGQKTNAHIFRLGTKKKNWDSKHIGKTKEESSFYVYKNLEIQKYLNRFFKLYGLNLHSYKINYSNNFLQLFISYQITIKTILIINKIHLSQKLFIKNNRKRKKKIIKYKRLKLIKKIKKTLCYKKFQTKQIFYLNNFGEVLLESLSVYTKKKINIAFTFQNLNSNLHSELKTQQTKDFKNILLQLKKFVKNLFFKEAMNIMFITITIM